MKVASHAAFVVLVIGIAYLFQTGNLWGVGAFSIGLQLLAAGLMLWARITFGVRSFHAGANTTEGGLVTSGPYRYIRHPFYAAILLFGLTAVGAHLSVRTALVGIVICGMVATRILAEERFLRERYPEYGAYAAKTRRIIPFVL